MATKEKPQHVTRHERINMDKSKLYPQYKKTEHKVLREHTSFDDKLNRTVKTSSYENDNQKEYLEQFKVSDFALENLIEVGVPLQQSAKLRQNPMDIADSIDNKLNK